MGKTLANTVFLDSQEQPFEMGPFVEILYPAEPREGDKINYGNYEDSEINFYTSKYKTDIFRVIDREINPEKNGKGVLTIFVKAVIESGK